ncbi:MAG: hypothetical protein PHW04_12480 [Candidatus Wallbacteria bacterium]|nr:hypothetical protein [Candidatus Wallbacteria bacterium]
MRLLLTALLLIAIISPVFATDTNPTGFTPVVKVTVWIRNCWNPIPWNDANCYIHEENIATSCSTKAQALETAKTYEETAVKNAKTAASARFNVPLDLLDYQVDFEARPVNKAAQIAYTPVVKVIVWIRNCWNPTPWTDVNNCYLHEEKAETACDTKDQALKVAKSYEKTAVQNALAAAAVHYSIKNEMLEYKVEFEARAVN